MRHDTRGFTLIELLIVVVIIGILVSIVVPKFANGKERAMVAAMKSDLHNLSVGAGGVLLQRDDVLQRRAAGRRAAVGPVGRRLVTLSSVTASGWAAQATHISSTRTCAIFVGSAAPLAPATAEGQVACTP